VTLRSRDLQAVLSFVADAHDADGQEALNRELLDRLAELAGCEFATYEALDLSRRAVLTYIPCTNEEEMSVDLADPADDFWAEHEHMHRVGAVFVKQSDRSDRRERERIRDEGGHNSEFRLVDRIGFRVGEPRAPSAWLHLDSQRRDFDERDRELMLALRPHVDALRRQAVARRQAAGLVEAIERDTAGAIVVTEPNGRMAYATTEARALLAEWFGVRNTSLPEELEAWLTYARVGDGYAKRRNGCVLNVQAVGDFTLVLRERREDVRLTPREREVLDLVAEGLTNDEIARLLWVARSTVSKHLEQAYVKLGVHTRTAAVARLAELSG
jgi:DNA-binding CsgD family transcriptional regulator